MRTRIAKWWVRTPLLVVALAIAAAGCGSSDDDTSQASAAKEKVDVLWIGIGPNSFQAAEQASARKVATKDGAATLTVQQTFDANAQINMVQNAATSKKYDTIILSALNPVGVVPAVKRAIAADIKVVADNSPIGPRTDTVARQVPGLSGSVLQPGDDVADLITELVEKACEGTPDCKVGYIAGTGSLPFDIKVKSNLEGLQDQGALQFLATGIGLADRNASLKATQNMLQAHPDINVIAALADQSAVSVRAVAERLGKDIKVVSSGASVSAVAAVRAGEQFGTVLALPEPQGRLAMEIALAAARGEAVKQPEVDPTRVSGLPLYIYQGNLDEFADFRATWDG